MIRDWKMKVVRSRENERAIKKFAKEDLLSYSPLMMFLIGNYNEEKHAYDDLYTTTEPEGQTFVSTEGDWEVLFATGDFYKAHGGHVVLDEKGTRIRSCKKWVETFICYV